MLNARAAGLRSRAWAGSSRETIDGCGRCPPSSRICCASGTSGASGACVDRGREGACESRNTRSMSACRVRRRSSRSTARRTPAGRAAAAAPPAPRNGSARNSGDSGSNDSSTGQPGTAAASAGLACVAAGMRSDRPPPSGWFVRASAWGAVSTRAARPAAAREGAEGRAATDAGGDPAEHARSAGPARPLTSRSSSAARMALACTGMAAASADRAGRLQDDQHAAAVAGRARPGQRTRGRPAWSRPG